MKDTVHIGSEARERLIAGIRKTADAVKITMGTGGANAIIEAIEAPGHLLTNDGWTIANSLVLADPIEEMGRKILLEAINRANKQSGDGSSTTCLLTAAILEEGMKHLDEDSPMGIKRSLEACLPIIEESIEKQKRSITVDEVGKVATISSEDPAIGAMLQEIYQKVGKDGLVYWDISKTGADYYTLGTGITVDGAGFVSPYMADIDEKTGQFLNVARWKNPKILITKQKISSASDFNGLFAALYEKEIKEVVVFCEDYEPTVIPDLVMTRAKKGFKTLLIKMPVLWKDWWYEDLAKVTGATVIDPVLGISHKTMKMEHLGTVENITVTKTDTYIDGMQDVTAHIAELEADGTDDGKLRAARLNTKTARYFVGATSDSALSYRRLKVEDAISASWQALQNGVVPGGGVALLTTIYGLPPTVGGSILGMSLSSPFKQIANNAGHANIDRSGHNDNTGLDTRTGKLVDMFDAGILDPANVVLNSVRNAISVAASVLTASVVIELPRQDITDQLLQAILSKGQPQ